MGLIKFKKWISENMGQAPMPTTTTNPGDIMQQLHQQLNDPKTPPQSKQGIMAQIDQLRKGTQANPAQPSPAPNTAPKPTTPAYQWKNGKPVPVQQAQI